MNDISTNIMVDPSLIVAKRTMKKTFLLIGGLHEQDRELKFYFPESFRDILHESKSYEDSPVFKFFMQNARPSDLGKLKELTDSYSDVITGFEVSSEVEEKYKPLFGVKSNYKDVLRVLFEEWVFLNERSWIVSRIKKPFSKLVDGGDVCLQFGKRSARRLVEQTIRGEVESRLDILRAFGKWIAVGGPSILLFFNPIITAFGGVIAGYFLLFDPETTTDQYQSIKEIKMLADIK